MIEISPEHRSYTEYEKLFPLPLQKTLENLANQFAADREALLQSRIERQRVYDLGGTPHFEHHHPAKVLDWKVAPIPKDLLDRRVEITGPISNTKMVINMLSANQDGEIACMAMLDFEDSMAPTWENVLAGVENVIAVANQTIEYTQQQADGSSKVYSLDPKKMAHPMVRVRGLHLEESHVLVQGKPVPAGLFDLTMVAYHTARVFLVNGQTPKFYVPKCEHYLEARWWNSVFDAIEVSLDLQKGSLKTTFLIETLPAAFQMEEILYEIRERACGLNGGRWDKIFSDIKTLRMHPDRILANRSTIDMKRPWMDNYAKLLIKICHKHGAFAMGGMAAFTPGKDAETRAMQTEKVIADKRREAEIGHDGCWVSHPYFISIAKAQFKKTNQLNAMLSDFPNEPELLPQSDGPKTLEGLRQNIRVGIAYQQGWTEGLGCIAFENLMEDLATLEISRAQVWQWLHHKVELDDGTKVTEDLIYLLFDEECERILKDLDLETQRPAFIQAKTDIQKVFLSPQLPDFFTQFHKMETSPHSSATQNLNQKQVQQQTKFQLQNKPATQIQ